MGTGVVFNRRGAEVAEKTQRLGEQIGEEMGERMGAMSGDGHWCRF